MSKVYLSPSKQPENLGVGDYGNEEERCNQITDVIEKYLVQNGIEIKRSGRGTSLSYAIQESNSWKPDLHFAIHTNAGGGSGQEIYAYSQASKGYEIAKIINKNLAEIMPFPNRGVKFNKLAETNQTTAPANLIEIIFHDNLDNVNWFLQNIELIGKNIAYSILQYFGVFITEEKPEINIPEPQQKVKTVQVKSTLTLREFPSINSKSLGNFLNKTTVIVLEENSANADGYSWDKVQIRVMPNKVGYMANKYLV